MKGRAVETRVRKYGTKKKKKKKVGKIETRSDREKREGEKETGYEAVCVWASLSQQEGD